MALRSTAMLWATAALVGSVVLVALPPPLALAGVALLALFSMALVTPLVGVVALLILAPLRTLIATEAALQLPLDIGQLTLLAALALWGTYRVARRQPLLPRWSWVYVPVLVFLLTVAPGGFVAASAGAWLSEILKWVQVVMLIAVCLTIAAGWRWLVFGLVLAGSANALIGLYEFFGGSGALHLLVENRFFRAFGTFGQPNPFGGFMGLLIPLACTMTLGYTAQCWREWRVVRRVSAEAMLNTLFYGASTLLLVAGIVASWSRGAWLGFAVALLAVVLALPRKLWQGVALLLVVLLAGAGLWFSGRLPVSVVVRITTAAEDYFAFGDVRGVDINPVNYAVIERLAHWQAALNMARANPWFGVGFGNYEVAYEQYRLINWKFALGHAHNYYLNIFAEAGMIGLIGYTILWVGIIYITWQTRHHPDFLARCTAVGLFGTWTYLAIHSLTDSLYVNNLFLHIGVMLGVLAVLYHQKVHRAA